MHRAACSWSFFSSMCSWNSYQSRMRSWAFRSTGSSRRYSMKPVGFPMGGRDQVQKNSVKPRVLEEFGHGVAETGQDRVAGKRAARPEHFELARLPIDAHGAMPEDRHPSQTRSVRQVERDLL